MYTSPFMSYSSIQIIITMYDFDHQLVFASLSTSTCMTLWHPVDKLQKFSKVVLHYNFILYWHCVK